jgi:hypothetical protein
MRCNLTSTLAPRNAFRIFIILSVTSKIHSQGFFDFNNRNISAGIEARVTFEDGTPVGTPFKAAVFAGPEGAPASNLQFVTETSSWRTGLASGYWQPLTVGVPETQGGQTVTVQARVYEGATWESSLWRGESNPVTLKLATVNALPTEMIGLQPFQVHLVPEPSTFALMAFGGSVFIWRMGCRRRV